MTSKHLDCGVQGFIRINVILRVISILLINTKLNKCDYLPQHNKIILTCNTFLFSCHKD